MTNFVEGSQHEQSMHLNNKVPSIAEFWEYRLSSSAIFVTLAINEYATELALRLGCSISRAKMMLSSL